MKTIEFADREIELVKSRRNKYMRLTVSREGRVRLSVPISARVGQIKRFLDQQSNWLEGTLENLPRSRKLSYRSGEFLKILGKDYQLEVHKLPGGSYKAKLDEKEEKIYLFRPDSVLSSDSDRTSLGEALTKELRKYAKARIDVDARTLAEDISQSINRISIREQRTRWGSCSNKGNLNFNWKIILAPESVYRYVIAHEVAHLQEHHHGPEFWDLVEQIHPNFKADKLWLKRNATLLDQI